MFTIHYYVFIVCLYGCVFESVKCFVSVNCYVNVRTTTSNSST